MKIASGMILPLVCGLAGSLIGSANAAPIFTDSFESGDLAKTTNGFTWGKNPEAVTVSSAIARTGSKSLRFQYLGSATDDAWSELRFDLGKAYSEVTIKWYLYFPNGTEGIGPRYVHRNMTPGNNKLVRLWGNNPRTDSTGAILGGGASLFNLSATGDSKIGLEYWSTYVGQVTKEMDTYFGSKTAITDAERGRWIEFVYHAKAAASRSNPNGIIEIWCDGKQLFNATNLDIYPGDGYLNAFTAGYVLGWANTGFTTTTNIYVDDFEVIEGPPTTVKPLAPAGVDAE